MWRLPIIVCMPIRLIMWTAWCLLFSSVSQKFISTTWVGRFNRERFYESSIHSNQLTANSCYSYSLTLGNDWFNMLSDVWQFLTLLISQTSQMKNCLFNEISHAGFFFIKFTINICLPVAWQWRYTHLNFLNEKNEVGAVDLLAISRKSCFY